MDRDEVVDLEPPLKETKLMRGRNHQGFKALHLLAIGSIIINACNDKRCFIYRSLL